MHDISETRDLITVMKENNLKKEIKELKEMMISARELLSLEEINEMFMFGNIDTLINIGYLEWE